MLAWPESGAVGAGVAAVGAKAGGGLVAAVVWAGASPWSRTAWAPGAPGAPETAVVSLGAGWLSHALYP